MVYGVCGVWCVVLTLCADTLFRHSVLTLCADPPSLHPSLHPSYQAIDLSKNKIDQNMKAALGNALLANPSLYSLHILHTQVMPCSPTPSGLWSL
jgi:hypothetical protein